MRCSPWEWSPQLADEWFTDIRAVRGNARSTLRSYQEALRLFCAFVTDPAYGWAGECHGQRISPATSWPRGHTFPITAYPSRAIGLEKVGLASSSAAYASGGCGLARGGVDPG